MLQGEITRHLVVGIPIKRKIVGAYRHATDAEVGADAWGEELLENGFFVLTVEGAQGSPPEFVEARAEPLDRLQRFVQLSLNIPLAVQGRRGRKLILRLPLGRLSRGDPLGRCRRLRIHFVRGSKGRGRSPGSRNASNSPKSTHQAEPIPEKTGALVKQYDQAYLQPAAALADLEKGSLT